MLLAPSKAARVGTGISHRARSSERRWNVRDARIEVVDLRRPETDLLALVTIERRRLLDRDAFVHLANRGDQLVLGQLALLPPLLPLRLESLLQLDRRLESVLQLGRREDGFVRLFELLVVLLKLLADLLALEDDQVRFVRFDPVVVDVRLVLGELLVRLLLLVGRESEEGVAEFAALVLESSDLSSSTSSASIPHANQEYAPCRPSSP